MRTLQIVVAAALSLLAVLAAAGQGAAQTAASSASPSPWRLSTDAGEAARFPDRFAWRLFVALTWPADMRTGGPDPGKPYGAEGPIVFETWAPAQNVYLADGAKPPAWEDLGRDPHRTVGAADKPLQLTLLRQVQPTPPGTSGHQTDEVRMNRATYDYIRDDGLYSIEGQQRFFYSRTKVDFPVDAMEIKAVWRPIGEADKPRYHWAVMTDADSGATFLYGLTTLHVTSKALPNWHWSTFEHVDNPFRRGIHDEGWLNPSRDAAACAAAPFDCNLTPKGFGLDGTRWENYRLRGSQIDYVDDLGQPVILGNSELETGFQTTASCMTCHGRSTIGPNINGSASFEFGPDFKDHPLHGPDAARLPVFKQMADGRFESFNGAPTPDQFLLPNRLAGEPRTYLPLDFVWSLMRATNEKR